MTTISNTDLPGYEPSNFRRFMNCIQRDWNLPQEFQNNADFYFLRHWQACELYDKLAPDGINIEGVTYFPIFKRASEFAFKDAMLYDQRKKFWLSFRAVRYPLGSNSQHQWALKAYVLIQEDTRSSGHETKIALFDES